MSEPAKDDGNGRQGRGGNGEQPGPVGAAPAGAGWLATAGGAVATLGRTRLRGWRPSRWTIALLFLIPALVFLGVLVVYPIFFSVVRSLYGTPGQGFVGFHNYKAMFTDPTTLTAIKNNAIWVAVAPTLATLIGLVFAVVTERVKLRTAFKIVIFMPMAISFLSAGVIWRLVYEQDPHIGLANAGISAIVDVFRPPGQYPNATPSQPQLLKAQGYAFDTASSHAADTTVLLGLVGIRPSLVPSNAVQARPAQAQPGALAGTVWLDFKPGGGGTAGAIDPGERGLPGIAVEALQNGKSMGSAKTALDGTFFIEGLDPGVKYAVQLGSSAFRPAYGGFSWLGAALVTPSIIVAYIWIWAGFAMVLIAAGLAAIPRDVLEAARVDGASEWQVFRKVTVPLLMPVILVVLVTLVVNVLKIFDLVIVIPPESTQAQANVIALQMWRVSFGGGLNQGLGSALAVFLFILIVPAMAFNVRRFRSET
ncbi:MAG: sugar ABC transporter permease [Actinobacteria bacterium]|nr:sugar ABC transporter permease [Actinomycetota bacterium]